MAFSQSDLDSLDRAIAAGELEVWIEGRKVRYQSADDMLARRNAMQRVLDAQATPDRVIPRHQLADFSDSDTP